MRCNNYHIHRLLHLNDSWFFKKIFTFDQPFTMINIYEKKISDPGFYRQFKCGESLISLYNCPLQSKYQDAWSHHNYIVYVISGQKKWHTAHGSYDLREGSCVFVQKGACIIEQFFNEAFCLVMLFLPDEFICDVLKSKASPIHNPAKEYEPVIAIDSNAAVYAFFQSMMVFFGNGHEPDQSLLELKFRELILTIAGNPDNGQMLSYFCSLLNEPQAVSLQRVMDNNYCFNLKLPQFARLSNRSLSAFKRDFQKHFNTTPGKWLIEKRLNHAMHLLTNADRTVSEAAFESGFENPSHFSRAFRERFGTTPASVKQAIPA